MRVEEGLQQVCSIPAQDCRWTELLNGYSQDVARPSL